MKTILNIIVILLVAAAVAGTLTLIVNHTSIASSGQPPAMTDASGQNLGQPPVRPEGEGGHEDGASLGSGLLEILMSLVKLSFITAIVLLIEKARTLFKRRAPKPAGA